MQESKFIRKALVSGATGFIGSHVARALASRGVEVRVLARSNSSLENISDIKCEVLRGDLTSFSDVLNATRGCSHVFHVGAAYQLWTAHSDEVFKTNVDGTRNIMVAAKEAGVDRVVYTSTVGTIGLGGDVGDSGHNERSPLIAGQMVGPYKQSKFEAEAVALQFAREGLDVVVVNPSAPIGPGDIKPTPTGQVIIDFLHRKMPAYIDTGLNIVDVRDVAEGHLLAAEKGGRGERYILGNQNLTLREIFKILSDITGISAPKVRMPWAAAYVAGAVSTAISDWVTKAPPAVALDAVKMARHRMYFDSTKAVQELGLPQTPVVQAFTDAVQWFLDRDKFNEKSNEREHNKWQFH